MEEFAPLANPVFRKISRIVDEMGVEAYVVGGYVRDYYLRRPSTDIDVVVVGSGIDDLSRTCSNHQGAQWALECRPGQYLRAAKGVCFHDLLDHLVTAFGRDGNGCIYNRHIHRLQLLYAANLTLVHQKARDLW